MQIMFADETNRDPSTRCHFYIYGGLVFPHDIIPGLHEHVKSIREIAGYHPTDKLKFSTNFRPEQVDMEDERKAKREILELCVESDLIFLTNVVHHEIIGVQDRSTQFFWSSNPVLWRYNQYLKSIGDTGFCIFDHQDDNSEFVHMIEKFTKGLLFDRGRTTRPLENIINYSSTRINSGHMQSIIDIVLGCFAFVVNDDQGHDVSEEMIGQVSKLLWFEERNGKRYVRNKGLTWNPPLESIGSSRIRLEYENLIGKLDDLTNR